MTSLRYAALAAALAFLWPDAQAWAHGIEGKDAAFVAANSGEQILPFLYLGAKHMVTGYDHLLFILGVVFFLYRMAHVAIYVTLFSIGHSVTLMTGVLNEIDVSPFLVDAVIGLSVAYKAFDNLGGFQTLFGFQPGTRTAVLAFGLVHGFGLATKLQDLNLAPDGLVTNLVSFNVGVELGQLAALSLMLIFIVWWRTFPSFNRDAVAANAMLMMLGFALAQFQLIGYLVEKGA